MTEATKLELFRQYATTMEDDFGMLYDREEEFYNCPECGDPIYLSDLLDMHPVFDFWSFTCPICCFHPDTDGDFYEPPEKQWSPSNPWDAPGMSIKDFL